jgi:hypothetical protein
MVMQKIRIIGFIFENSLVLAVCSWAIYSMYLRLNLSTTPELLFQKPQHSTVLDLITGNFKTNWFCRILDKFTRRAKPVRITKFRISGVVNFSLTLNTLQLSCKVILSGNK